MTDKKSRQRASLDDKRKSLPHGGVGTETIDLNSLFPKEVTDSDSFEIQGEIWTTTFGRVIQALPIPVLLIDQSRNIMAANKACRKIGAGYEMMVGKPFSRLFANPPDALQSESLVSKVFSARKTSVWEALLKIDKDSMWGRLTFKAIKIRDQRFLLILVEDLSLEKKQHLLDKKYKDDLEKRVKERTEQLRRLNEELLSEIADRKRSEEALSRSEERFRQIAENAGEWIWEVDPNGVYRYCSSAVKDILGYSPDELVGKKHFYDLFAQEVREDLKAAALSAFERREPFRNLVNPNVHKNGEIRILETSGSPILDSEGTLLGYLGVDKDFTDRKEIEEALRTSEAQLSNALTMAHLGHWEYDVAKDLFTFNDHLYKIFRTTAEQVGGYTMSSADYAGRFVHPDDISVVADETRKAIESSDPLFSRQLEHRILYADGEIGYMTVKFFIVKDNTGLTIRTSGVNQDITDRKRAEESLRESEDRYRQITENSLTGIFIHQDGVAVYVNQKLADMLGYTKEETIGRPFLDALHQEDFEMVSERARARLNGELSPAAYEVRLVRKTGEEIWCEVLANLIEYRGRPALMGNIADITERKQADEQLRNAEQRYRSLFEDAPVMYVITRNEQGVPFITDCNELFLRSLGYKREEVVEKALEDFYSPQSRSDLFEGGGYKRALAGEFLMGERQLLTRSGRLIPTLLYTAPEVDSSGQVIGTRAMFVDITERRRAEEALSESEQRYRAVIENLQIGISVINPKMEIIAINRFFQNIYPHVQPGLGQRCYEMYNDPPSSSPCSYCPCVTTFQDGMVHESVTETPVGDGIRNYRIVSCPIKDAQGHVELVVELAEDITERRALQSQLAQAQKMEAVGTLAGGIAHDFNNLLTIVMGFSELLLADKEQDNQEYADVQKIFNAAKNGAELVHRLLTFSRKVEPKPIPLNLNIRIVQVGKLLRRTIPKMIDIQMDLSEDLAEINADPTQMEQVLMNLGVNARDAMPDGGKLTLGTKNVNLDEEYCGIHSEAKPGKYVLLAVSDTGHGMERATIDHIFEPFYTTKELGRGTGLGLAMVYGIVKQHGGYITCYSEVGHGTTFNVYFPALVSEVEPDIEKTAEMPAFGTETVLLVDDEELVRDLGARILSKAGYQVLTATNGKEALDLFEKERTHLSLVILDLIMPVMGGKECLKELLKIDPQAKVLVASGFSADASSDEILELGAKEFVSKPFRFKELLRQVRNTLDQS